MTVHFDLGDYVPYLLNRVGVLLAGNLSRDLEQFGVTVPMWRVMGALLDEGEQRLGDLARLTAIELSTLSRVTASMENRGLVVRRRSGQDARAVLISLTEDGRKRAESIVPVALHWENVVIAGLSADERQSLKSLLLRLYDNIADAPADAGGR